MLRVAGASSEWMEEHFKPIPAIHPDIDRDVLSLKVYTNNKSLSNTVTVLA